MKSRRVLVTIEMTTDRPAKNLKEWYALEEGWPGFETIHQIQVNVIKKEKEVKK